MVRVIQSSLKCNNSFDRLSLEGNLALRGIASCMSNKSFNYNLSRFKLDATTFCNMKPSYFYYIIQNQYQKSLDDTVHLAKDVLNNIENACKHFLIKDVLVSLCAKILTL